MDNALWVAKTGLEAQEKQMAVAANNISNANTVGFKKSRLNFSDLMYQNMHEAGAQNDEGVQDPTGLQIGTGVRITNTQKDFAQGNVKQTGRDLDVMIEGRGFIQVQQPDGTIAYTRNGALTKGVDGTVETQAGYPIEPQIVIPENASSVKIGDDGTVQVMVPGQVDPQEVGKITLAKFVNPTGLKNLGGNLYKNTVASGEPIVADAGQDGTGTFMQGSLESSNVSVVNELVNMIQIQRIYEMNSNAISMAGKMLQYSTTHLE